LDERADSKGCGSHIGARLIRVGRNVRVLLRVEPSVVRTKSPGVFWSEQVMACGRFGRWRAQWPL